MKNSILRGDCLSLMSTIQDNFVDLTITSPPYDDLRTYGGLSEWSFDRFKPIAAELYRITKEGGVVVWNVGDATIKGSETGSSFRQALYFMDECGFLMHDTMIWQKSNFSNPSKTRYHQVFEYVFILSKGSPTTFNPIKDRPNVYAGKQGSFGKNTVTQADGSKKVRARKVNSEFGMRHNVWVTKTAGQEQTSKRYGHPAMFSEEFAHDHIISWSNVGDLVFDPFTGSGTTPAMAKKLGRDYLGCEVNDEFANIADARIADIVSFGIDNPVS